MFELYYLVDQNGDINGEKKTIAYFETIEECHARALSDSVTHYSIELETPLNSTIIFVA